MGSNSPPGPECIEWYPVRQLLGYPGHEFILIVLHQPIRDPCLFGDLWSIAETKIAADGGANRIYDLSKRVVPEKGTAGSSGPFTDLHTIIGDLDSLTDETRQYFSRSRIIREREQDSTDFAKAVHLARKESPGRDIVCMGGLGGRVDQGLSQLHHLYLFQKSPTYADGRMYLVSGDSLSFILKGGVRHRIRVREPELKVADTFRRVSRDPFAKHVGIVPVGEPAVISTKGFEWDVQNWDTAFGYRMSTSNHVLPDSEVVEVQADKDVLFTIALKQASND
ncbi:thiamine pyrophosphokinase [Xylaria bambusicola]|uniref:thiamine pyrophosphokinase n=1 Tax=Xylaria bambusicola TaxID=326684 RepID=UPI002008169A|nr:thiamine pyrophosphokinase [Xylaria bambusicola]KAI0508848.1 thiamine pyrophosphokinase [Xylaria bambusicola]